MEPACLIFPLGRAWAIGNLWILKRSILIRKEIQNTASATIAKIEGDCCIFCDRESKDSPYKVVAWRSSDINKPFEYLGKAIQPRSDETDDWDNYRIQDPDIGYIPELSRYVMTCSLNDIDGNPGGDFPRLKGKQTRVIGVFYSTKIVNSP